MLKRQPFKIGLLGTAILVAGGLLAACGTPGDIYVLAGGYGVGGLTSISVGPYSLTTQGSDVYVADPLHNIIRKYDYSAGTITDFRGHGRTR